MKRLILLSVFVFSNVVTSFSQTMTIPIKLHVIDNGWFGHEPVCVDDIYEGLELMDDIFRPHGITFERQGDIHFITSLAADPRNDAFEMSDLYATAGAVDVFYNSANMKVWASGIIPTVGHATGWYPDNHQGFNNIALVVGGRFPDGHVAAGTTTVAHEMGHCLGLTHVGDNDMANIMFSDGESHSQRTDLNSQQLNVIRNNVTRNRWIRIGRLAPEFGFDRDYEVQLIAPFGSCYAEGRIITFHSENNFYASDVTWNFPSGWIYHNPGLEYATVTVGSNGGFVSVWASNSCTTRSRNREVEVCDDERPPWEFSREQPIDVIFPQPAIDHVHVNISGVHNPELLEAELLDMIGRRVSSGSYTEHHVGRDVHQVSIDVSGVSPGQYIMIIRNGDELYSQHKVVVQR